MITAVEPNPAGTAGTEADERFLHQAIEIAVGAAGESGGPFGAIVVRDGVVVGEGSNQVVASSDPSAHAEVVALRAAAGNLGTHLLNGCVVYASCEPCPMCLAASFWARIDRIVFAGTRHDAAAAGFDDAALYAEMMAAAGDLDLERTLPVVQMLSDEAGAPFAAWARNPDRVPY